MNAVAREFNLDFDPAAIDLGDHTHKKQQLTKRRGEPDYNFLNRVVICHGWQVGDQLELRVDSGRLASAEITAQVQLGRSVAGLTQPSPELKSITQSLMFLQFGSLTLVETVSGLTPIELRVAFRQKPNEDGEAFDTRIKRQAIHPMSRRCSALRVRRFTAIDDAGRSTTHVVMTFPQ